MRRLPNVEAVAARLRRRCLRGCEAPAPALLAMYLDCLGIGPTVDDGGCLEQVALRRFLCRGLCA